MMIRITVNEEPCEIKEGMLLTTFLKERQLVPDRVAVMLNGQIIRKKEHAETRLEKMDELEILVLAGGG